MNPRYDGIGPRLYTTNKNFFAYLENALQFTAASPAKQDHGAPICRRDAVRPVTCDPEPGNRSDAKNIFFLGVLHPRISNADHGSRREELMHNAAIAFSPKGHALFLIDEQDVPDESAPLMEPLPESVRRIIGDHSTTLHLTTGSPVFEQGLPHAGIFVIEEGSVRTFYAGPNGKEITLAYWTEGHFVGGPELFGRGHHVWSAEAASACVLSWVPGLLLRKLAAQNPDLAMGLIDALIVKGRCYSSLAQILGTKPARGRLAELLLALAERSGSGNDSKDREVPRHVTHEQLAAIIGSTRQWVTATLARFERDGFVSVHPDTIVIHNTRALRDSYATG